MHHHHSNKPFSEKLHVPLVECTFLHYQAGRLDGFALGYRQGAADMSEINEARAEHAARVFYAMTVEDADWRGLTRAVGTLSEVAEARREAGEWARLHCTYAGGPVNFFTGRPVIAEGRDAA